MPAGIMAPGNALEIRRLGRIEYAAARELQRELVERRARGDAPDTALLCEHPPVITVGRGVRDADASWPTEVRGPEGRVRVVRVERGGLATYHGPGQLVAYLIVRLDRHRLGLDVFLRRLEEAMIRTCRELGVAAARRNGYTGVWVADGGAGRPDGPGSESSGCAGGWRKVASIGVAVRRWVTFHGAALNVRTDLRGFRLIRPCGFDPEVMTSMAALCGEPPGMDDVAGRLASHLSCMFGRG